MHALRRRVVRVLLVLLVLLLMHGRRRLPLRLRLVVLRLRLLRRLHLEQGADLRAGRHLQKKTQPSGGRARQGAVRAS